MNTLDLHGESYEDAKKLTEIFIENNLDLLPIQIITGNSNKMKKIICDIIDLKNLSSNYTSGYNLGSVIITEKRQLKH